MARRARRGRGRRRLNGCNNRMAERRGRKPIFTDEQKRVLRRLVCSEIRNVLRGLGKAL